MKLSRPCEQVIDGQNKIGAIRFEPTLNDRKRRLPRWLIPRAIFG
jgi:hypothetical protein